jgi:hypothetical protein
MFADALEWLVLDWKKARFVQFVWSFVRSESACGLDGHTLFWHVQNTIFRRHCVGGHWVFVDVELNGMVGWSYGVRLGLDQKRQTTRDVTNTPSRFWVN